MYKKYIKDDTKNDNYNLEIMNQKYHSLFYTLPFFYFPSHYFTVTTNPLCRFINAHFYPPFSLQLFQLPSLACTNHLPNFIPRQNTFAFLLSTFRMYVTKQIQNKIRKKKIQIHQRSILREMMNTCDKLDRSFLTKAQQKSFQSKQRQERQLNKKTSFLQKQNLKRFSHDPFKSTKDNIVQEYVFVKQSKQFKQIKDLKEKMLPKVNKTNIQKKLKQLTYIRNMGFKTTNKRLQSFKSLTRQQDEQNILNKSWENFYQDKIFNSPVESPSQRQEQQSFLRDIQRKRTNNASQVIKHETKNKQNDDQKQLLKKQLKKSMSNFTDTLMGSFAQKNNTLNEIKQINFSKTNEGFHSTCNSTYIVENSSIQNETQANARSRKRQSRVSTRNKPQFRDVIKSLPRKTVKSSNNNTQIGLHLMSSERKKQLTDKIGLTRQRLQKQSAYKLYTLVKGGYDLDRNDVQGQNVSLKRFKQAKENFKILNTCFNKVRQYRYIIQQPEKVFNDSSFKSLVYLSEIENKINPNLFKRIQKMNNVVD